MAVAIVLAVRLVVLVVVADQVGEREAVVRGHEVDGGPGSAAAVLEDVAGTGEAGGEVGDLTRVALPESPHGVAVAIVPFRPPGREAAEAIAAVADVPGLGDQLDPGEDGILADRIEKAAVDVEVATRLAGERGRQVEAEAVDVHLLHPVAQGVHDQLQDL